MWNGKPKPLVWIIAPKPKSDQIALTNEEIQAAFATASRDWGMRCFDADTVDAVGGTVRGEGCLGVVQVNWISVELLRKSTAGTAGAVAGFTAFADDSGRVAGGNLDIAYDPVTKDHEAAVWTNYVQPGGADRSNGYFALSFRTMATHEYGHSLGLEDVDRDDSVMLTDVAGAGHLSAPADCDCSTARELAEKRPSRIRR